VFAADLRTTVAVAGMAVTVHALAYSVLQLVWGPLQTKWGRVRVLVVSTTIGAGANVATAFAPDISSLIVCRGISGGAYAATFAAVLVYLGDSLPVHRRPHAMSNLATAAALGLAVGTFGTGAIAEWLPWRTTFAGYAVLTIPLLVALVRLPPAGDHRGERLGSQLRHLAGNRWALAIYGLTALEGFLLIGVFNFLPVALQQAGSSVFVSGLATAAFGVLVVVVSQVMKLFVHRVAPWTLLLAAGVTAVAAFVVLAVRVSPLTVLSGAGLMGVAWALGHTTLQGWATDAVADARAMGMTFFSISLMLGGAAGAGVASLAAGGDAFGRLFALSVLGAAVFGLGASLGAARYRPGAVTPRPVG